MGLALKAGRTGTMYSAKHLARSLFDCHSSPPRRNFLSVNKSILLGKNHLEVKLAKKFLNFNIGEYATLLARNHLIKSYPVMAYSQYLNIIYATYSTRPRVHFETLPAAQ